MTKLIQRLLVLSLLLVSSTAMLGQKTTVKGTVTDAVTGDPLPFVNLFFQGTKTGTSSDLDGNYFLSSYYVSDSLTAAFVGYKTLSMPVEVDEDQTVNFQLESSAIGLVEAVVTLENYENPAHPILESIIRNKPINNRVKLETYSYEAYNKVEFDIHSIDEKLKERKIMKSFEFILDNIDSTGGNPYLPIFMTESLSEYHYRKSPKSEREEIKATNVSGLSNNSVSQFLGDMYQSINIYDNNLIVFGKSFVSPVSNYGLTFYRYYLQDSAYIDNKWCYQIQFVPRRKTEALFDGNFWVNDTTYAIKQIEAEIVEQANVNFIEAFEVIQSFNEVEPEVWMLTQESLVVDFRLKEDGGGFFGRKNASFRDFKINQPYKEPDKRTLSDVVVAEDANLKTNEYWETHRHIDLSENESKVFAMMDTLTTIPRFKTFVDVVQLFVTGYKVIGPIEIGPYSKLYSFNPIEGNRVRLGARTSNAFSTKTQLEAYVAYGFKDNQVKYGGGISHFLDKRPRTLVGIKAFTDLEQLGLAENAFAGDDVLSSVFRRNPASKLTRVDHIATYLEREWFYGLSNRLTFTHRRLLPLGDLEYTPVSKDASRKQNAAIITSEVSLYTRFAFKEKFVSGAFDRLSLGTKYPTLEINYTAGLKGVIDSQYEYHKLVLRVSDKIRFGPFGYTKGFINAGKIWGALPFPLLELHQGNETFFYQSDAFNTMNFFEFVSDTYASAAAEHHFEGMFLNNIPLMKKLKWREVVSAKILVGSLSDKNKQVLVLPEETFLLSKPFSEVAVGVENIFKILRVDALWRLSYLDNPDIVKFGVRAKLQIDF